MLEQWRRFSRYSRTSNEVAHNMRIARATRLCVVDACVRPRAPELPVCECCWNMAPPRATSEYLATMASLEYHGDDGEGRSLAEKRLVLRLHGFGS
jgi:hypothetical protein